MYVYKSWGSYLVPKIKVSKCKVGDGSSTVFLGACRKCLICDKQVNCELRSLQSSMGTACKKIVVYKTIVLIINYLERSKYVKARFEEYTIARCCDAIVTEFNEISILVSSL